MTFIICVRFPGGIVIASDSRITLTRNEGNKAIQGTLTDSATKTFLTPCNVSISAYDTADVDGLPISKHIQSFISEKALTEEDPETLANVLLSYFREFNPIPDTKFVVAGYKKEDKTLEQAVYYVNLRDNKVTNELYSPGTYGSNWYGVSSPLARLLNDVYQKGDEGRYIPVVNSTIHYNLFTLQDAIDFSVYACETTMNTLRFQSKDQTVGGPIDILVIEPNKAFWVQRKQLKVK